MATQSNSQGLSKYALLSMVVFGGLAALTVVDLGANRNISVGVREMTLPTIDRENISKVDIAGKFKAILTKEGEAWMTANPDSADKKFPADQAAVTRMLDAVKTLEAGAFISARADKHEELEVNDEKGTKVTFTDAAGKALSIYLGGYAKGGGNYLRLADSDEVFVGKGTVANTVRKNADQWRNKRLFDFAVADMTKVSMTPAGGTPYALISKKEMTGEGEAAKETQSWTLADMSVLPANFRLDTSALGRIPQSLSTLSAAEFVDDAKGADVTGLDGTAMRIAIEANGKASTLLIGKEEEGKRYAQVEGNPQIVRLSSYVAKNVSKKLADLRDLTILGAGPENISRVTWTAAGLSAELSKVDGAWQFKTNEKDAPPFDASTVPGKLRELTALRAARHIGMTGSVNAPMAKTLTIDVAFDDGTTKQMKFGALTPKGKKDEFKNQVFAKVSDGHIYGVAKFQKDKQKKPGSLFKTPPPPPQGGGMGGMGGGMGDLSKLPPELRKQIEAQMKAGKFGAPPGR